MIPKRIFFYWSGGQMSYMRYLTLKSFRHHNPNWKMDLYVTDETLKNKTWKTQEIQDCFNYSGKDYFPEVKNLDVEIKKWNPPSNLPQKMNPVHMSDIFRWYMLSFEGGVYSDMDILFVKPFDFLYKKIEYCDTVVCIHGHASIGFMASSPNNKFFKGVYETSKKMYNPGSYQCAGVSSIYALLKRKNKEAIDIINQKWPKMKVHNLEFEVVYPFYYKVLNKVYDEISEIPENTIGIHWYGGSPNSQKFNDILNHKNVNEIENTFTHCARFCIE